MIVGRLAGSWLLSWLAPARLLRVALLLTLAGFAVYWGLGDALRVGAAVVAVSAVTGLFLTGVGIAPIYPLTLALAVRAAGSRATLASARSFLASGGAILVMPALLGRAADDLGLRGGMLIVPILAVFALASAMVAHRLAHR